MPIRVEKTRAIVINASDSGECDQKITFLTEKFGKRTVRAKGSKKMRSRFLGHIDLGNICDITIARGNSDQFTLTNCCVRRAFGNLKKTQEGLNTVIFATAVLSRSLWEGQGSHLVQTIEKILMHAERDIKKSDEAKRTLKMIGLRELGIYDASCARSTGTLFSESTPGSCSRESSRRSYCS